MDGQGADGFRETQMQSRVSELAMLFLVAFKELYFSSGLLSFFLSFLRDREKHSFLFFIPLDVLKLAL